MAPNLKKEYFFYSSRKPSCDTLVDFSVGFLSFTSIVSFCSILGCYNQEAPLILLLIIDGSYNRSDQMLQNFNPLD